MIEKIAEPAANCDLCPRLVEFREQNTKQFPTWFNGAVPSFGDENAELLIVGLAPGLRGANQTGRPFTGDYAGDLLYATLLKFGFAKGEYQSHPEDGLELINTLITNAVRCVPPQNKPIGAEIKTCRSFLINRMQALKKLKLIISLGRIAHESVIASKSLKQKDYKFVHGQPATLPDGKILLSSYHCSRYNTNTGRLTTEMFEDIFRAARKILAK